MNIKSEVNRKTRRQVWLLPQDWDKVDKMMAKYSFSTTGKMFEFLLKVNKWD